MATLDQHNATLRRAGLPTVETLTRRILATFDRATVADIEAGATWYDEAREFSVALGNRSGHGVEHAAAVIAHLSPRTTWTRNVVGAEMLLIHGERGEGIMGREFAKAYDSLDVDDDLLETTFGPGSRKTLRFFRNILGDVESVTVDVWAARAAGVDEHLLGRVGVYDAVEVAYQRAARRRSVEPATMQATCWVVVRGGRAA
jgi:hypothetical protein